MSEYNNSYKYPSLEKTYMETMFLFLKEQENSPSKKEQKLLEEKIRAIHSVHTQMIHHKQSGIMPNLLNFICMKKAEMLKAATTIQDVKEIADPPKPNYTGNGWQLSPNSLIEEEVIYWSQTSLKALLNQIRFKRYISLMEEIFEKKFDE